MKRISLFLCVAAAGLLVSCASNTYNSQLALLDQLHAEGKLSDTEYLAKRQELVTVEEGRRTRAAVARQSASLSMQATANQWQTQSALNVMQSNQMMQNQLMQNQIRNQQSWNRINSFSL